MNTGAKSYFINSNLCPIQTNFNPSMMMPVFAVHVLVGNFFFTRLAHADDFDGKAQCLACQRVVAV